MKNLFTFLMLTFTISFLQGQVAYVDADATGAQNGSSWADAYTSLDAALMDSTAVDIWVAAGTYIPGGNDADTSATFRIDKAVNLYGGFSGSETNREERNPAQNETVLSGDIMQNDNGGMDPASRQDNARHVIFVEGNLSATVTISGFTISGGQTSDNGDHDIDNRAGGGIYTESAVMVDQCIFTNNFGRSGGGICVNNTGGISSMVRISECTFEDNVSTSQSAGLVMFALLDAEVLNCSFIENTTNRGVLYPADCQNVLIRGCTFEDNVNPTGFGGAMFSWQNLNLTLENCTYRSNESVQAACMYYDAREIVTFNPSLTIRGCNFQNNSATDGFSGAFTIWQGVNILVEDCEFNRNSGNSAGCILYNGSETPSTDPSNFIMRRCEFGTNEANSFGGGACYFSSASFTIDSCTFLGNIGANSGGALFCTGSNKNYIVKDCFFGLNNANYGGAMTNYGNNTYGVIRNCEFLTNNAGVGGGSMNCGFKARILLDNCSFTGGTASVGGAISAQNDSTTITVRDCVLENNTADNNGGGFFTFTGDLSINLENSVFTNNSANFGAAVHLSGDANIDTSFFTIDKCIMNGNTAVTQGGAINIINKSGLIQNTLIYENIAENIGTGGAISTNASDSITVELTIRNATLSNNLGLLSNGIAAWTDSSGVNRVRIQNTILDNGRDYVVEDGQPELISLGGNFTTDPFIELLLGGNDIVGVDAGFVNAADGDFHLTVGSPCIDAGVPDNAPEEDLDGQPRDAMPDIGSYEYNTPSGVFGTPIYDTFDVWPNPANEYIELHLPDGNISGTLHIYNSGGQLVYSDHLNNTGSRLSISHLNEGTYFIFVNGSKKLRATFLKI